MVEIDMLSDEKALEEIRKLAEECTGKCLERAKYDALKKGKTELSRAIRETYTLKKSEIDGAISIYNDALNIKGSMLTMGPDAHFKSSPKAYASQKGIPIGKTKRKSTKKRKQYKKREKKNSEREKTIGSGKRKKAYVEIYKGRKKELKGGFIVNPEKTHGVQILFTRDKKKLKSAKSLSLAQMATKKSVIERTEKVMQESLQQRLEHYLEREAQKNAND